MGTLCARADYRLDPVCTVPRRPMRAYAQWLFPEDGPDRSEGKEIWLVYGTRYETNIYYKDYFEALAARKPNFH